MGKASLTIWNRKALSPIFATLIILAVVTVLFIPVFIWATGLTSSNQDSWQQSGITATERIVIEEVSIKNAVAPAHQSCTVYVRNIGETAVIIQDVIIAGADGSSSVHAYQKITIPTPAPAPTNPMPTPLKQLKTVQPPNGPDITSIIKGDLIEIQIPWIDWPDTAFLIQNGVTYTIKVFTTRGVSDSYQVVATWPTPPP